MVIGIGISTYKRPAMLNKLLESIYKYTTYDYILHIAEDTDKDRKGVAKIKNECLRALKDADHIFLFDDDVQILKKGWEEFFIKSGQQHLLFLDHKLHKNWGTASTSKAVIDVFRDCGGVFMYMTRAAADKVGAFNEEFKLYGFEHAEYSIRILGEHGNYPMLRGTEEYLYSEDYSNPDHISSITNTEKTKLIRQNQPLFFEGVKKEHIKL
jgi:glycosyltransferase involved in cell wall biosynthesis